MSARQPLFLALDQGGHSSRAMVLTATGETVAKAQVPIETVTSGDTHVEHSPEELAQSLLTCCNEIGQLLGERGSLVKRAGLATQRSSIVCWQRSTGKALSRVLSWQDRRASDLIDARQSHAERVEYLTGLVMSPHYGASKLRWCLDNNSQVGEALAANDLTIGPLASFLLRALTRSSLDECDPANASRTLLWDRHARDWSEELCDLFGVDRSLLPASVPTRNAFGSIDLGDYRVPLELVTGDQSAAIYAFGDAHGDAAFINCGTGAFMQCPIGHNTADVEGLLNSVVYQDQDRIEYVLEGTVNGAGRALSWWSELHKQDSKTLVSEALERLRKDEAFAAHIPVFLNGISGLGAPYWRSDFVSRFVSATTSEAPDWKPDPQTGAVAIVESLAFLLCENVNRAQEHTATIQKLVLTGGLASVDYLCQSLATVTRTPTIRSEIREATSKGVGFLLSQDTTWSDDSPICNFVPGDDEKLIVRHEQWKRTMTSALRY